MGNSIYLFSLILGVGASLGLLRLLEKAHLRWLCAGLIALAGALLGARAGFVIAYAPYFKMHPQEITQLQAGGLSWPGALAGFILFSILALFLLKLPRLEGLDRFSRLLLPMVVAIWLAGWQAGIAYGQALPARTWWGAWITDDSGMNALRVPLQPAAVLSALLLLGIGEALTRGLKRHGVKAALLLSLLSLHCLLFSLMRVDAVQSFLTLRLDTWASAFFLAGSLLFLLILLLQKKQTKPEKNMMEIDNEM